MSQQLEQFNLEQMFLKYLNLTGQKVHELLPQQLIEIKRAYYGAAGQMLVLFRQDLQEVPDTEIPTVLDNMMLQIKNFWDQQNKQQNG